MVGLVSAIVVANVAGAHTRSESYSHWHLSENSALGTVTIPLREVMLLYQVIDRADTPPRELFREHLVASIGMSAEGADCVQTGSNLLQAASGFVRVEVAFDCGDAPPDTLTISRVRQVSIPGWKRPHKNRK